MAGIVLARFYGSRSPGEVRHRSIRLLLHLSCSSVRRFSIRMAINSKFSVSTYLVETVKLDPKKLQGIPYNQQDSELRPAPKRCFRGLESSR